MQAKNAHRGHFLLDFRKLRGDQGQEAHKLPDAEEARKRVKTIYERIRTKIISEVTVRRTRTDLVEHDDYKKDLEHQGVIFPKIEPPRKILYRLPPALEDLYDRTVKLLAPVKPSEPAQLTYNRYRAIGFLKPDKKKKYQNADRISAQLATIMRTLLVKRLDSSFHAFKESLRRFATPRTSCAKCLRAAPFTSRPTSTSPSS
jgi:hypothetical protein